MVNDNLIAAYVQPKGKGEFVATEDFFCEYSRKICPTVSAMNITKIYREQSIEIIYEV